MVKFLHRIKPTINYMLWYYTISPPSTIEHERFYIVTMMEVTRLPEYVLEPDVQVFGHQCMSLYESVSFADVLVSCGQYDLIEDYWSIRTYMDGQILAQRVVNINRQSTPTCSDIILYHHQIQNNMQWYYTISPLNTVEHAVILYHITTKYKIICSDIILYHL